MVITSISNRKWWCLHVYSQMEKARTF